MGDRKQPTPLPPEPGSPEAIGYTGAAPSQFRPAQPPAPPAYRLPRASGYRPDATVNPVMAPVGGTGVRCVNPWATLLVSDTGCAIEWIEAHTAQHRPVSSNLPVEVVEYGRQWLIRARAHLIKSFERELTGRRERITTELAAMAILRGVAAELDAAGNALDTAAEALRDTGHGKAASLTKQAATRAHTKAGEIAP